MEENAESRAALRDRVDGFIRSPEFENYYRHAHMSKALWVVGQVVRCMTIVGLRGGLEGLAATRGRAFASPDLRKRYAELAHRGKISQAYILINAAGLEFGERARGPALAVVSLEGTDGGDAAAARVADAIVDRLFLEDAATDVEQQVSAMISDERYVAFRKRELPREFCGGESLVLLDLWLDTAFVGFGLMKADALHVLVDPAPQGLVMLVPNGPPKEAGGRSTR